MPPQVTCASALPGKTRKHENHIFHSIGLRYTHNALVRYLPERKKLSSVMCLIVSNIWRVKSEPHQTWHGDRGPRARSCASKTFGGSMHSFAARGR